MKKNYFDADEIETSSRMKRYSPLLKIYYICLCIFVILTIVIFSLLANKTRLFGEKEKIINGRSVSELLYIIFGTLSIIIIVYCFLSILVANIYIFKLEKFRNKNKNQENYKELIKKYIQSLNKLSKFVNIMTLNKNMSDYIVEYFYE